MIGWYEEYEHCGCLSEVVDRKSDLCGHCPKHGTDSKRVYRDHKLLPGMNEALSSADIKRVVLQRLRGFLLRQAIRDARRLKKTVRFQAPQVEQRSLFE
jgi:hypothetical protein